MQEKIDGVVQNDGIINFLGGRNFIVKSAAPEFAVDSGREKPIADVGQADYAILPYDDPNELPFVVDSLMTFENRRMYDTGLYPSQFLPYQYLAEQEDCLLTNGLSLAGPFNPYEDYNELPFVIDSLMTFENRRMYDTEFYPSQFLPYQHLTEQEDCLLTNGQSLTGLFSPET